MREGGTRFSSGHMEGPSKYGLVRRLRRARIRRILQNADDVRDLQERFDRLILQRNACMLRVVVKK